MIQDLIFKVIKYDQTTATPQYQLFITCSNIFCQMFWLIEYDQYLALFSAGTQAAPAGNAHHGDYHLNTSHENKIDNNTYFIRFMIHIVFISASSCNCDGNISFVMTPGD